MALSPIAQSPLARALLQLVPGGIGSAIDVFLSDGSRMLQEERLRTFFDELGAGSIELTSELLTSHDFLHCFFATSRAAVRSRRGEKIRMLAHALSNGIVHDEVSSVDEFEEALEIIDRVSMREWRALVSLQRLIDAAPPADNEAQKVVKLWPQFIAEVELLGIPPEEAVDFVHGTARFGLFTRLTAFWDDDGTYGTTTPIFRRLTRLVRARAVHDR